MKGIARVATLVALTVMFAGAGKQERKPVLVPPVPGSPVPKYDRAAEEKKAIEIVQRASAHDIDSMVADTSFADWFRDVVGPKATISWEFEDCGTTVIAAPDYHIHYPSPCTRATADFGEGLHVSVLVGHRRVPTGAAGPLAVLGGSIAGSEDRKPVEVRFLSDLEEWSRFHKGITGKK